MLQGAIVNAQLVKLPLLEVAHFEVLALGTGPRQGCEFPGEELDEGRLAGPVSAQQADSGSST